jgi:hypothetical protein
MSNMKLSFLSRISIPISKTLPEILQALEVEFSADGSKFAIAMDNGRVSVWEICDKIPLKTFVEVLDYDRPVGHLQFSSGKLGKETLAFVEVCLMSTF